MHLYYFKLFEDNIYFGSEKVLYYCRINDLYIDVYSGILVLLRISLIVQSDCTYM